MAVNLPGLRSAITAHSGETDQVAAKFGVCVNLVHPKQAASQYSGWRFNSFCMFESLPVAVDDAGICLLGANTDNGALIPAFAELKSIDLEKPNLKKLRWLVFGFEADDVLAVVVAVDDGEQRDYTLVNSKTAAAIHKGRQQHMNKVVLARSQRGRYMNLRVGNVSLIGITNGADFSVDTIDAASIEYGTGSPNEGR